MEFSIFPYNEDCLYAVPWAFYRKVEGCYLAEGEELDDYLPYVDVLGHLRREHDLPLWLLTVQDAIKEILTSLLSSGFPEGEDLQGKLRRLRDILGILPEHPLSTALLLTVEPGETEPANSAARAVALWHQMHNGEKPARPKKTVETMSPVEGCLYQYPPRIRNVLEELHEALRGCAAYLEGAYLHGSLATLDFVPGASDLDLVYLLHGNTCCQADSLLELRALLKKTRSCFYSIDPFQHHGPYVLTPRIQENYLESYLPLAVWRTSRPFTGPRKQTFTLCPSPFHDQLWFRRSVQYYRRCHLEGKPIESGYEAKLLASMASLLPAIAHTHVSGTYTSKREAFEWVRDSFPDESIQDWMARLTHARKENLFWPGDRQAGRRSEADRLTPLSGPLAEALTGEPYMGAALFCDRVLAINTQAGQDGLFRKYSNFPKPVDVRLYDRVMEKVTSTVRSIPGVTRLLVSGTLSHPGISDLDLVIVTQDTLPWQSARKIEGLYDMLGEQERALVMHPPMAVLPERLLPEAPWLFPLSVTRALCGEMPRFTAVSARKKEILCLVLLADFATAMNGRLFQEMIRRREIDVRLLLNELGGLKYALALLEEAGGQAESFSSILQDIETLRKGWIENPCTEKLPGFLKRGVESLNALQQEIGRLWQRVSAIPPDPFEFLAPSSSANLLPDLRTAGCHWEDHELVMHLALPFAIPLSHYSSLTGPLSEFLRRRLPVEGRPQHGELGEVLSHRASLLNAHFSYLVDHQLPFGFFAPFHFGWRLDEKSNTHVTKE